MPPTLAGGYREMRACCDDARNFVWIPRGELDLCHSCLETFQALNPKKGGIHTWFPIG